ncbi:MAG: proline dehydrogenase family protein [Candidatus Marsarchaeota archaeon]|jgi:proline dehydrogenase|nr:proline dehydrogenase family protein [Candidatus Marsarchaeota archaeon]MCL5418608.1 proline dehydrogenase family protein [Candidatus Marsarchaeota archaeon]
MTRGFAERLFAGRWIAGPDIGDAIERAKRFNIRNISAILNYLGEEYTNEKDVKNAVSTYTRLIKAIKESGVKASISVKPTELGLSISYNMFEHNYRLIVESAESSGIFVWMDMEEPEHIESAIKAYLKNLGARRRTGICLQANMKRSFSDMKAILRQGGTIRLVKGAYSSDESLSYKHKEQIDNNFIKLMRYMFLHARIFTIATHDTGLIELARRLNAKHERHVTYAMLNGIRNNLAIRLAQTERVSMYVPFGTEWVPYSYRRLKESGHAKIIFRSLFEKQGI